MALLRPKQFKFTAQGDILVGGVSGVSGILSLGTNGQILRSNGTSLVYATNNATGVINDSAVTGATVKDALNNLQIAIGSGGSVDLTTATLEASKSNATLPLINYLTPKFNPANYTGFVGDGTSSDQTAIDSMFTDIDAIATTKKFICIEMPSDRPVRGQIKKLLSGGSDLWRNVFIEGNNSELIANTKPATLGGASPLAGDGILHFQGIDGLTIENLKVNGLCYNGIATLTQTAGVATCTTTETHNLVTGDYIAIMDVLTNSSNDPVQRMRDDSYNGAKFITVTGATTFTYPVHPNATASPVITAAKCTFKTTQFGGDNIRLVSCTRVLMNNIDTRHGNDHAIYFVSTTNGANTTDGTLTLTDNNVVVNNLYVENCTQTSSTPSGVREMIWNNTQVRFMRGGAVKFASHLLNGETVINNLQCFDFSNVGNATTPNGLILEGNQRFYMTGFNFYRAGGIILLPNPTSGRIGQRILKDITIQSGAITDCGYCYTQGSVKRAEQHSVIIGDNTVTIGNDSIRNITVRDVEILRPYGKGYQIGNNNAGSFVNINVIGGSITEPALQALDVAARNSTGIVIKDMIIEKTSPNILVNNWVTGTSYSQGDVVYVSTTRTYFRKSNAGTATSTIEPPQFNGNALSDGCAWKNIGENSVILFGPREGAATDFSDDAIIKANIVKQWSSGSGVDFTKVRRLTVEGNILNKVGHFSINCSSSTDSIVRNNTVSGAGTNPLNSGNNINMLVEGNYLDVNNQNRNAANFNNEDGITFINNIMANSTQTTSALGTTLTNIRRFKAYNNTGVNCAADDTLYPFMPARRRNIDDSFFSYQHKTGLSNNDPIFLTAGATITNKNPISGRSSSVYVTESGYNARNSMSSNLSATGLSGAYFNPNVFTSGAFTGAATAWNWTGKTPVYQIVGNNGAGTPVSGSTTITTDLMGIPDGATINSCGHWTWISWNDFGYSLMANGQSVGYETGKAADLNVNARASGTVITAMSYDSGTGVVTCTAAGHELTNGERYTIARTYPTTFQVNADSNTDGTKDSNPVTVIDANTFTYTVATGLTSPVMGIVLIRSNSTYQGNCSITSVGTLATMTVTSHGLSTGDLISVRMATDAAYNVTGVTCTVVDPNTITYTMATTPASGTAVVNERLVVFGMYWSEAHNTRTVGAGGFVKPKTRGIPWGDYFLEFYGKRADVERLGILPFKTTLTITPGSIAAGTTLVLPAQTLNGITSRMIGRATSLNSNNNGLEARVIITGNNTYQLALYNPTATNITPASLTYNIEVFNTLPWSVTESVI